MSAYFASSVRNWVKTVHGAQFGKYWPTNIMLRIKLLWKLRPNSFGFWAVVAQRVMWHHVLSCKEWRICSCDKLFEFCCAKLLSRNKCFESCMLDTLHFLLSLPCMQLSIRIIGDGVFPRWSFSRAWNRRSNGICFRREKRNVCCLVAKEPTSSAKGRCIWRSDEAIWALLDYASWGNHFQTLSNLQTMFMQAELSGEDKIMNI